MTKRVLLCFMVFIFLAAPAVFAMEGRFEGVFLAQYTSIPATGANVFDITRLYLTHITKLNNGLKLQYTSDVIRDTATTGGRLDLFTKFAWLEMVDGPLGGRLRFGLVATPWIGFEDGVWGYRVQGSTFTDRLGLLSSADFGVSLDGKIKEGLEYHGVIVNGSGFKSAETDRSKRFELRLTGSLPGNNLVSGFISKDYWSDEPAKPRDRYIVQLANKTAERAVGVDYALANGSTATGKNGAGYCIFGTHKLPLGYSVIARLDQWDPDTATAGDSSTRYIVGAAYELFKGTIVLLDVDRLRTESGAGNNTVAAVHLQVKY